MGKTFFRLFVPVVGTSLLAAIGGCEIHSEEDWISHIKRSGQIHDLSRFASPYFSLMQPRIEEVRASDKTSLHVFCGLEFGALQFNLGENWVRLKEHFGPFGWIRGVSNASKLQRRVDAEQTYLLRNGPTNLIGIARGIAKRLSEDHKVEIREMPVAEGTNLVWIARGYLKPYRLSVSVSFAKTNEAGSACGASAYTLRMDIVNEELGEDPSPANLNRRIIGWDKVFRPISIDPADEGAAAAWRYRPPDEPSTEEQIMVAIREKNESLVPRFAGYPGIRRIENLFLYTTGCTEGEADSVAYGPNWECYFFRYCKESEMQRLEELSSRPHRMRPRAHGEKRAHSPGYIDGAVLPGDSVSWTTKEGDWKSGVVASQEEDGEYVEAFKAKIRVTKVIYRARPEDWHPSPKTLEYRRRVEDLRSMVKKHRAAMECLWKDVSRKNAAAVKAAKAESRRRLGVFLAELRSMQIPGVYVTTNYSVLELPTREAAAKAVKRNERQALVRWQSDIQRAIEDELNSLRIEMQTPSSKHNRRLSPEECRELDLSGDERRCVEVNRAKQAFSSLEYHGRRELLFQCVVPPHVPEYPIDNSWAAWSSASVREALGPVEVPCADMLAAFDAYIGICKERGHSAFEDEIETLSERLVGKLSSRGLIWLLRQYCLDRGEDDRNSWRLMKSVRGILMKKEGRNQEVEWIDEALRSAYCRDCSQTAK